MPTPKKSIAKVNTPSAPLASKWLESLPQIYYDADRKEYLRQNERGEWLAYSETQIRRCLRIHGVQSRLLDGERFSPMDKALMYLNDHRSVAYAAPLAGRNAGLFETDGRRILVTESPNIPAAALGPFPLISEILRGMFPDEPLIGDKQRVILCLWVKLGYESLISGKRQPGQALAIAGPVECGKTLLQSIFTIVFGGRFARPYGYMSGRTRFNAELFKAEHLAIDDEQASFDLRSRRAFAGSLKQFTAAEGAACEAKYRTPLVLDPFWRVSITLNDEPECLAVLPPMTADLEDKLILLRAQKREMPMPTQTAQQRFDFYAALRAEIPAFLHYLQQMEIPAVMQSPRFGVTHFHHPTLLEFLGELAPEARLLELIDATLFSDSRREPWEGTAIELERFLRSERELREEVNRLLTFQTAVGSYLGRLAKGQHASRIRSHRTASKRVWIIEPPQSDE